MTPRDVPERPARRGAWALGFLAALAVALVLLGRATGPDVGAPPGEGRGPDGGLPRSGALRVHVRDDEGGPLAGAEVALRRADRGPVAVTDGEGEARFGDLRAGPYTVLVEAPGFARGQVAVEVGGEEALARVALEPGSILTGRVLSERGEPLQRAFVRAHEADCDPQLEASCPPAWIARAGEDGRFALDTLGTGAFDVHLTAEGYSEEVRRVEVAPAAPTELQVALHQSATLRGTVRTPAGAPAAGATVVLAGSGIWPPRSQPADEEGAFAWEGIPGGVYELRARDGRRVAPPREGIVVEPGQQIDVELVLVEGETIAGRVVDDTSGAPIEGAELVLTEELLGLSPRAARTGADGRFSFPGLLPRTHHLSARAEGYVALYAIPYEPSPDPLEVRLVPGATLRGVVYDARDRPVEGAVLEVLGGGAMAAGSAAAFSETLFDAQLAGPSRIAPSGELGVTLGAVPPLPTAVAPSASGAIPSGRPSLEGYVTDAQGRFAIGGLPAGTVQVLVQHPDHAPAASPPVRLAAGATSDEVEVILPDGGTLRGRVVDPRGFPVPSVLVELAAEREPLPRTVLAGDDGSFEIGGAIGVVTLTAYPAGRPAARERLEVPAGATLEVRLTVETELHTLRGRTVDPRGFPVPGAEIALRSLRARSPTRRATLSGDDGTFVLDGLPPPPYALEADHPDYTPTRVERVGSTERELTIALAPGGTLRGEVRDAFRDLPAVGARVIVEEGGDRVASTTSDNVGRFEFSRIRVGNYEVIASLPGLLDARRPASLREPRAGPIALDLGTLDLEPGGRVLGEVVDALGDPVAGAEVVSGPTPSWTEAVRTDDRGTFELLGLPPGDHLLWARHPEAGPLPAPVEVRVHPLERTEGVRLRLGGRLPLESHEAPEAAYQTGVAVTVGRSGGAVVVEAVVSGSEAERAGLRVGDALVSVDGETVQVPSQARSLLRGPVRVEAVLELRRGGRTVRLHVPRERFRPPDLP